jgi:hypothetical protein
MNLFRAKLRNGEQKGSKVHFCLMLRSKTVLSRSKSERVKMKFCFKANKTATESVEMVCTAYGD